MHPLTGPHLARRADGASTAMLAGYSRSDNAACRALLIGARSRPAQADLCISSGMCPRHDGPLSTNA